MSEENSTTEKKVFINITNDGAEIDLSCIAKEALLKSLGLYWRTWPESKPQNWQEVAMPVHGEIKHAVYRESDLSWERRDGNVDWHCQPGDRWLPLLALENLP